MAYSVLFNILQYPMSENPRGTAIIISNPFMKDGEETRSGSGKDVDRMNKLFRDFLHFNTYCYKKGLSAEVKDFIVIMFLIRLK